LKRTGEMVLGVIGIVVYAFFGLLGALIIWIQNNQDTLRDLMETIAQEDPENAMTPEELNEAFAAIGNSGWLILSTALILVAVGIVALVFLKGDKRPKPAGIMLIVAGLISVPFLGQIAFIGALPFFIAGIMCLVRKPPVPLDEVES